MKSAKDRMINEIKMEVNLQVSLKSDFFLEFISKFGHK